MTRDAAHGTMSAQQHRPCGRRSSFAEATGRRRGPMHDRQDHDRDDPDHRVPEHCAQRRGGSSDLNVVLPAGRALRRPVMEYSPRGARRPGFDRRVGHHPEDQQRAPARATAPGAPSGCDLADAAGAPTQAGAGRHAIGGPRPRSGAAGSGSRWCNRTCAGGGLSRPLSASPLQAGRGRPSNAVCRHGRHRGSAAFASSDSWSPGTGCRRVRGEHRVGRGVPE